MVNLSQLCFNLTILLAFSPLIQKDQKKVFQFYKTVQIHRNRITRVKRDLLNLRTQLKRKERECIRLARDRENFIPSLKAFQSYLKVYEKGVKALFDKKRIIYKDFLKTVEKVDRPRAKSIAENLKIKLSRIKEEQRTTLRFAVTRQRSLTRKVIKR